MSRIFNRKLLDRPNDCQFEGDPCKVCGNTVRYLKGHSCVFCSRKRDVKRRSRLLYPDASEAAERRRAIEDHIVKKNEQDYWGGSFRNRKQ